MEENVLFLFRSCCHGNCVPLDVRAQCLFVSTLWPAAAPSTDLLMGKELKILRSHSLAEVGIEQLEVRPCFQEDSVDTRATA